MISGKPTSPSSASGSLRPCTCSTAFTSCSALARPLDKVRAEEARRLKAEGTDPVLSKSRWCFLKRKENLTDTQALKLSELLTMNLRTVKAYLLTEDFKRFWKGTGPAYA